MARIESLKDFARVIFELQKSDRDANLAVAGFTGEGKSTFLTLLFLEHSLITGRPWTFEDITWSRKELMFMIDGLRGKPPKGIKLKVHGAGLLPGQMPEYSSILVDELWLLFYKRNWYEEGQIDAIGTLNMCRDRHLLIGGNIPNFWDLDIGFQKRMRFYAYVPERGVAWIFEQENNPFSVDPWNASENKKAFRKNFNPFGMPNFICEIRFPDWSPHQKRTYYGIRNQKRLYALDAHKSDRKDRYTFIKEQRDNVIRFLIDYNRKLCSNHKVRRELKLKKLTMTQIGDIAGLNVETIKDIWSGER